MPLLRKKNLKNNFMSLENGFLQELDGRDPDGFVNSMDRRSLIQTIKDLLLSSKKPTTDFRNLPDDILGQEEDGEH